MDKKEGAMKILEEVISKIRAGEIDFIDMSFSRGIIHGTDETGMFYQDMPTPSYHIDLHLMDK
ncbi:MAG: hypothetical protein ABFD63_04135 [Smithella sp.]